VLGELDRLAAIGAAMLPREESIDNVTSAKLKTFEPRDRFRIKF
jgi:hypothetical protein